MCCVRSKAPGQIIELGMVCVLHETVFTDLTALSSRPRPGTGPVMPAQGLEAGT